MFQHPLRQGGTGYPVLAAGDVPKYGTVNPRPNAADLTGARSSSSLPTGPLFGEHFTSVSDASLFQPNISPDVVSVCIQLPSYYFRSVQEFVAPSGTILSVDAGSTKNRSKFQRTRIGVVHTAHLSTLARPQIDDEDTPDTDSFMTVCVGDATFRKNTPSYVAVAVQNVCRVSTAGGNFGTFGTATAMPVGTRLQLCSNNGQPCVEVYDRKNNGAREIVLTVPADNSGTIVCDLTDRFTNCEFLSRSQAEEEELKYHHVSVAYLSATVDELRRSQNEYGVPLAVPPELQPPHGAYWKRIKECHETPDVYHRLRRLKEFSMAIAEIHQIVQDWVHAVGNEGWTSEENVGKTLEFGYGGDGDGYGFEDQRTRLPSITVLEDEDLQVYNYGKAAEVNGTLYRTNCTPGLDPAWQR